MYKLKFIDGEWMIVDSAGIIISDVGEFASKSKAEVTARKLNSDDYTWKHAPACDAPHMDNF